MGPTMQGGNNNSSSNSGGGGGVGIDMTSIVGPKLADEYQDSKDVLEYLTGSIFSELKGAAADAERDRQRRLKEQQQQRDIGGGAATASDELEQRGSGGFWVSPETGKPGSGTPKSSPRGGGGGGKGGGDANPPRSRSSEGGGGGGKNPRRQGGRGGEKVTTVAPPPPTPTPREVRDQAVELWSTKVAPVVAPVVTSLRGAMARGPAYDYDGPEDTAAVPLANWPGRDADPNGWHARRRSYAQAERAQVRKRRHKVSFSFAHTHTHTHSPF